ncbi:MAG: RDD family protein [Acidobacteriota bacterium]|nr:RDD family protein [Acidobacteriota bacterium]
MAAASPAMYPAAQQAAMPVGFANPRVEYAGFWLRVVAYLIDGVVIGLAFMALFIPFATMTGLMGALGRVRPGVDPGELGAILGGTFFLGIFAIAAIGFIGTWLYHALMESSAWEATLGKKALNLRVTGMNGERITFGRASGRHFGKILTGLIPLGVGFILAGLTEKRQALHDMLAGCLVLRDI